MYDAGVLRTESGGRHRYLVMEYVEGLPITEHARARALTEPQIVRLLVRVASAVRAFHQRAVIHRDLKPSNILVDASGEPKVLDFGVARLLPSAGWTLETIDGAVLGTPGYMSPEQIETPRDIDVRADVWSLGVLAYEMLSGRLPIDISGLSAVEAVRRVARSEPAPLSRVAPRVRPDLARVVMKALSRDREARYGSAEALLEDLENAISDRPVSARDGGWAYRAAKLVRRRRAAIAAAAAVLAVGSVIAAMQVAAWRRAAVQRDRAIAVNTLLAGMINSASPHFGDRNVLMRDVLVGLEAGLADRSVGMPLVEADVRSLLGRMSFALGEYERSRALLEEAIALREGGGDLAARLSDRGALATTLRWLYLPEEAMRIAEAAESEARRSLGPRHPTTLEVREVVAGCLDDLGRIDEAERIYRGLLAQRLGAGEGRSDAALVTMGSLASLLSRSGKYAESETLYRQAAEGWSARGQRLEALTVRANLAMVVASQGRLDEAITMYEVIDAEALECARPDTLHDDLGAWKSCGVAAVPTRAADIVCSNASCSTAASRRWDGGTSRRSGRPRGSWQRSSARADPTRRSRPPPPDGRPRGSCPTRACSATGCSRSSPRRWARPAGTPRPSRHTRPRSTSSTGPWGRHTSRPFWPGTTWASRSSTPAWPPTRCIASARRSPRPRAPDVSRWSRWSDGISGGR